MDKILTASQHLIYDTTTGGFPSTAKQLNLKGKVTTSDNMISLKVTSIASPGKSTARGFYFSMGQKHHRVKYSFDYRFVPDVEGETAVMNLCGYEGATPFTITMTPEWQTYSGLDNRSNYSSTYYAFTFYRSSKTFPLGTFYIRNFKLESFPWVYTIGGKPLMVSV